MPIFNIRDARTHLSQLIKRAQAGQDIVISKAGKPVARLVPHRSPGSMTNRIWISPDFDKPDKELQDLFYNGPIEPPETDS